MIIRISRLNYLSLTVQTRHTTFHENNYVFMSVASETDKPICFIWQVYTHLDLTGIDKFSLTSLLVLRVVSWYQPFNRKISIISILLRLYSKSTLTLKEWRLNLSFPWVSMLFLNSWRVSLVPLKLCDYSPSSYSNTALTLEGSSDWTSTLWVWVSF